MGANTKIEWAHHSVNFWWGCTFARFLDGTIRPECMHCYAKLLAALFSRGKATWGADGKRWIRHEAARRELYKFDRSAFDRGVRERVFINSMSDTFEDRDDLNEARGFLWDACKFVTNLDILLLTKRPGDVMRMVPVEWQTNWPAHVWIGTTAGTQQAIVENVPALLSIPARIRFLSCEPLFESLDLQYPEALFPGGLRYCCSGQECGCMGIPIEPPLIYGISWVIAGGESGPGARPMHPDWARSLRNQCADAGVPFLYKQWGEWHPATQDGETVSVTLQAVKRSDGSVITGPKNPKWHTFADGQLMARVGVDAAGRMLDGVEHNGFPEVAK